MPGQPTRTVMTSGWQGISRSSRSRCRATVSSSTAGCSHKPAGTGSVMPLDPVANTSLTTRPSHDGRGKRLASLSEGFPGRHVNHPLSCRECTKRQPLAPRRTGPSGTTTVRPSRSASQCPASVVTSPWSSGTINRSPRRPGGIASATRSHSSHSGLVGWAGRSTTTSSWAGSATRSSARTRA